MLSVLNLNPPAGVIPKQVFSDVALDKLISRGETAVLSEICTPTEFLRGRRFSGFLRTRAFTIGFRGCI